MCFPFATSCGWTWKGNLSKQDVLYCNGWGVFLFLPVSGGGKKVTVDAPNHGESRRYVLPKQEGLSGIQPQSSVIPRKEGWLEGGAGLGPWHCIRSMGHSCRVHGEGARCPHELPWSRLCLVRAKEWGHSTGMSNTLSEGAEVAGFILIWKCGPCCLLWRASLSCLWQLWEYWFWQTAARSSRLEGVSSKCDKRGKLLTPGGKAQGSADYQKAFRSCEEEEVSSHTGMDGQKMNSSLPLTEVHIEDAPLAGGGGCSEGEETELMGDARGSFLSLPGIWLNRSSLTKRTGSWPLIKRMDPWELKMSKLKAKTMCVT